MRKVNILGNAVPIAILVVVILMTAAVSALFVNYFMMTKPATVSIKLNAYGVELYEDENCTQVMNTLDFGEVLKGDPNNQKITKRCYIKLKHPNSTEIVGKEVRGKWRIFDLPESMALEAKWYNGTAWNLWERNKLTLTLSGDNPKHEMKWTLDVGEAGIGDYSFNVIIRTGE